MAGGLSGLDVAVLAGGLGTRVRDVLGDKPKILAPIDGRPFLDHLLDRLERDQPRRVVFCLGHMADHVVDRLRRRTQARCAIEWTIEREQLGTGGALRQARSRLASEPVLVMNGDTWPDIDFKDFVSRYRSEAGEVGLACVEVDDVSPYGAVDVDGAGWVRRFVEKQSSDHGPGLVSAGVYLFSQRAMASLEDTEAVSLERDFLQSRPENCIKSYATNGSFIDIGTPDTLARAGAVIATAETVHAEPEPV